MPRPDDQTGAVPHLEAVNPGPCALTTACGPSRLRLAPSSWGQHLDAHIWAAEQEIAPCDIAARDLLLLSD